MKRTFTSALSGAALAAFLFLAASPKAFAQMDIKTNIPFSFEARGKLMPPGDYTVVIDRQEGMVTLHGPNRTDAVMQVLTTLAATPHSDAGDAHLIFDKVGDSYALSEVWEPGSDGLLLFATKGPHEHHVIHIRL